MTTIKLTGQDGNIFNLMGIATIAMKQDDREDEANEMRDRIFSSGSYSEALEIITDYCEIE